MGKRKRKRAARGDRKNKSLDHEAGAIRLRCRSETATEFHCFRCDTAKTSKTWYEWSTSGGTKVVCNGCHGFLCSAGRRSQMGGNSTNVSGNAPKKQRSGGWANIAARIDVFYGRTDNTPGDKRYGCVVVRTTEAEIQYYDDVYEPRDCRYEVLFEAEGRKLHDLLAKEPACDEPSSRGWVSSPLKERVLTAWQESKSHAK